MKPIPPLFYEGMLESPKAYERPDRDVDVTVQFSSPTGRVREVTAFWDGGRCWRFRFSPDEAGTWSYRAFASDGSGDDWNGKDGEIVVRPYAGPNPLYRHGPIRVAKSNTHLEHADGTPFFWVADTVWNGVLKADPKEWQQFLRLRKEQGFNVIQCVMTNWRALPADSEGERAHIGDEDIQVNPAFFRRLDAKVAAIAAEGLVPALVVLWTLTPRDPGTYLPEDDAIHLARYIIHRYAAFRPVWFLGGDGRYLADEQVINRWKTIGNAVFGEAKERALTTLHPCGVSWLEPFREEPWFDFIGYQSSHGPDSGAFDWIVGGEPATHWNKAPQLPVINLEPCYEGHKQGGSDHFFTAHDVRIALYSSLLASPTAGVTYGHASIWPWLEFHETPFEHRGAGVAPRWSSALETEGVMSVGCLKAFFDQIEWWKLHPAPHLLAKQPGKEGDKVIGKKYISISRAIDGSFAVAYLPQGGSVSFDLTELGNLTAATWMNPRSGTQIDGGTIGEDGQLEAPGNGDWVLHLKAQV